MSTTEPKKAEADQHLDPKAQAAHHDEVIVVPAGQKRWRFYFTFGVIVFVLMTFMVSDLLVPALTSGGSATESYLSWRASDGEEHRMSVAEFYSEKRKLQPLVPVLFGGESRDPSDEQLAAFLIQDREAQIAGVQATKKDVQEFIRTSFTSKDHYDGFLRQYRLSAKQFEDLLRRVTRYQRYVALLSLASTVPDPVAVEKRWKGMHQEYAFDHVELVVADLEREARDQAPDAAGLRAWYDALPLMEKAPFETKDLVSAELCALSLEGEPATTALFERYPRPADENAEEKGRKFYDDFGYAVYRRDQFVQGQDFRKSFDEVRDQAILHAKIYNSLSDWRIVVDARATAGETIDLESEASALGLSYRVQREPMSQQAWTDLALPWLGQYAVSHMFDTAQKPGLLRAIVVERKGFVFGRVTERVAPRMPDYDEVAPAVLDAWGRVKARELALARLEKVRDALGERPDPATAPGVDFKPIVDRERFLQAARDAGFTPVRHEWSEQYGKPDPEGDGPDKLFYRANPALYGNQVGSVPAPIVDRTNRAVYLVRLDGIRDPDPAGMEPLEVKQIEGQIVQDERQRFVRTELLSSSALTARHAMVLKDSSGSEP